MVLTSLGILKPPIRSSLLDHPSGKEKAQEITRKLDGPGPEMAYNISSNSKEIWEMLSSSCLRKKGKQFGDQLVKLCHKLLLTHPYLYKLT